MVTDEQGNMVSEQNYYPYGQTRASEPESQNTTERQYTGQVSDQPQTGLYYYNARYYSPQTAGFTQADTQMGPNRYLYSSNNPINYQDSGGNNDDYWQRHSSEYIQAEPNNDLYLPVALKANYFSGGYEAVFQKRMGTYVNPTQNNSLLNLNLNNIWQNANSRTKLSIMLIDAYKLPSNDEYNKEVDKVDVQLGRLVDEKGEIDPVNAEEVYRLIGKRDQIRSHYYSDRSPEEIYENYGYVCIHKAIYLAKGLRQETDYKPYIMSIESPDFLRAHAFVIYFDSKKANFMVADPSQFYLPFSLSSYLFLNDYYGWSYSLEDLEGGDLEEIYQLLAQKLREKDK